MSRGNKRKRVNTRGISEATAARLRSVGMDPSSTEKIQCPSMGGPFLAVGCVMRQLAPQSGDRIPWAYPCAVAKCPQGLAFLASLGAVHPGLARKKCTKCGRRKGREEFPVEGSTRSGTCKQCHAERVADRKRKLTADKLAA